MPYADPKRQAQSKRDAYLKMKNDPVRLEARRKYGREHEAARRASSPEIADELRARVRATQQRLRRDKEWVARKTEYERARRHGITVEQLREIVAVGKCAICGTATPGGHGEWHVDHNHTTGAVREALCFKCNTGIGNFKEDIDRMQKAIAYLQKHSVTLKAVG